MISYSVDWKVKMMIIVSKIKVQKLKTKFRWLRIIDLASNKVIFKHELTLQEVVGRLKSQQFVLDNGHIYFDNVVIKFRYDLIKKDMGKEDAALTDEDIIDFYDRALDLDDGESVILSFPYMS